MNYDIAAYKQMMSEGASNEQIIQHLHSSGASILDSIKIYRDLYGVSLGVAKESVSGADCWKVVQRDADKLHEKLIRHFQ